MTALNVFFLLVSVGVVFSAKFPSDWSKCPKTNHEECLKKTITKILGELKNGRKDVGIVPIDPLRFDRMEINQGSNSPVNINLTLTDLDFFGASRLRIKNALIDWDKYEVNVKGDFPGTPVGMIGNYIVNGKVLVLPIQGKGKCNITIEQPKVELILKGKELVKNGKKYMDVVEGTLNVNPGRARFWFGNLFDGVPNLGDNMNKFLNENWLEVINSLNATLASALGQGVKEVANGFFHRFPVNELYT